MEKNFFLHQLIYDFQVRVQVQVNPSMMEKIFYLLQSIYKFQISLYPIIVEKNLNLLQLIYESQVNFKFQENPSMMEKTFYLLQLKYERQVQVQVNFDNTMINLTIYTFIHTLYHHLNWLIIKYKEHQQKLFWLRSFFISFKGHIYN